MKSNKFLLSVFAIGLALTLLGLIFIKVEITSKAMGVVQHSHETILHATRDGQLASVYYSSGESVKKGDIILVLYNSELEQHIIQLEKNILKQKSDLQKDRITAQINAITGYMPELQNIEEIVAHQNELIRLSELLIVNNERSLQQDLISKKQFYEESMERIREDINLLKNEQLQAWKQAGLLNALKQKDKAQIENQEKLIKTMDNQLTILLTEKERLTVKAPFDGVIIDFYFRHNTQNISKGTPIVKIADDQSGFQVKSYIAEKNIDMIDVGMKVRMESMVYHSQLEGYLHGTVSKIINPRDVTSPEDVENSFFETLVNIDEYPYPPVHGSRVEMEIIIGKGNLFSALINRPSTSREIQ